MAGSDAKWEGIAQEGNPNHQWVTVFYTGAEEPDAPTVPISCTLPISAKDSAITVAGKLMTNFKAACVGTPYSASIALPYKNIVAFSGGMVASMSIDNVLVSSAAPSPVAGMTVQEVEYVGA